MKKAITCFLLFELLFAFGYAQQNKIDSFQRLVSLAKVDTIKVDLLDKLGWALYLKGDYHKADSITAQAMTLAQKSNYQRGIAQSYLNLGNAGDDEGHYDDAVKNFSAGIEIYNELHDTLGLAKGYLDLGNIYSSQGNYPVALDNYLLGLKMSEHLNYNEGMGAAYTNIGDIYFGLGNMDETLKYLIKGLKIDEKTGNKRGMATDYENIAVIYRNKREYDSALNEQLRSLEINKELGNEQGIGSNYGNISIIYASLHKYEEGLKYAFLSRNTAAAVGNKYDLLISYMDIGDIYSRLDKYMLANIYFDSCRTLGTAIGNKDVVRDSYSYSYIMDSALGNYKAAYSDYKTYILYRDSIKNEANTKKMVSEEMTYEFDKKQAEEKATQDKKDAIAASDKKKQRILTWSVSAGLLLVLAFSGLLFSRFRVTQKQKRVIEEQKSLVEEKNREVLDSITYAKRLQDAILPPLSIIRKYFPESFVFYKPKDIVAGDFYWMEKVPLLKGEGSPVRPDGHSDGGEVVLIAAADCTGHGVPGAMVSVVCSNALNRAVKEFHITEPGKILDKVRELVIETFEKSENEVQDGMDISICSITLKPTSLPKGGSVTRHSEIPPLECNSEAIEIQWSGAYNALWYIQDNKLKEIEPDKQPIGKQDGTKPFTTNSLKLNKGDTMYLFTDGYADQFGGPKGKKFKYKQLEEILLGMNALNMDEQNRILERTLNNWQGSLEQTDDICIIGIRV